MSRDGQGDDVIDFTPEPGFTIESLATSIVQMMRDLDMDAHINLPDNIVIEIDRECGVKEIIDGYKEFLSAHIKTRIPSNRNEKEPEE